MQLEDPNLEARKITFSFWRLYYSPPKHNFSAPEKCNGCYNEDTFVLWAVAVAVQAVVDGARIYQELLPLVDTAIDIFQKYKNPKMKAFSAAENDGTDKDIYYDDNAQVCSAMISAYEVTGNKKYLDQGHELLQFLMGGWNDDPEAKTKGGMRWHVSKKYLNACTTAEVAKCCLQMARFVPNEAQQCINFAARCIDWQISTLQDPSDHLIKDGVGIDSTNVNNMKWTYNLGTTLSVASHLYKLTGDHKWKKIANELAEAGINRGVFFYDRDYPENLRYWRDPSYFVQLLIEGLADYLLYVGSEAPEGTPERIKEEIRRHLVMFYEFMRDPNDGLYLQSFEPHNTYRAVYDKKYKRWGFGDRKCQGLKGEDKDSRGKPQKCLMGGGAAARVFFQGARVTPLIRRFMY